MSYLPPAEVVSCYFDDGFVPRLAAMRLRWSEELDTDARLWHLPAGVRLICPLPESFGVRIHRTGPDAYEVCLLWNCVTLHWNGVSRAQLGNSALRDILTAIGTNIGNILAQPVLPEAAPLRRAA